jgi:hypothetical protein
VSIPRIAALSTALALGACSQKYSFDDWPDASHLVTEEESPQVPEELSQGMRAANDFWAYFYIGGPEEDQYSTWILHDEEMNEWLNPKATLETLPAHVQEACSRFLAWSQGNRGGLLELEDYMGDVPFIVLSQTDFPLLLEFYRDQPEVREAWFHLAQMHWNQSTDVLHDVVPAVVWKALAEAEFVTLEERRQWIAKYPIDRRGVYLRLAKGMKDWMGFWPTAPRERLAQRFPEGLPTEENQRLVKLMEKLLAEPAPKHGEPSLSAEELAWLKTTECYLDLRPSMHCLGSDSWLPWMVPEDGK